MDRCTLTLKKRNRTLYSIGNPTWQTEGARMPLSRLLGSRNEILTTYTLFDSADFVYSEHLQIMP